MSIPIPEAPMQAFRDSVKDVIQDSKTIGCKPKGEHFLFIHFEVCCHLNYLASLCSSIPMFNLAEHRCVYF